MHFIETSKHFENTRAKYSDFWDISFLEFTHNHNVLPALSPRVWISAYFQLSQVCLGMERCWIYYMLKMFCSQLDFPPWWNENTNRIIWIFASCKNYYRYHLLSFSMWVFFSPIHSFLFTNAKQSLCIVFGTGTCWGFFCNVPHFNILRLSLLSHLSFIYSYLCWRWKTIILKE